MILKGTIFLWKKLVMVNVKKQIGGKPSSFFKGSLKSTKNGKGQKNKQGFVLIFLGD
jgi:hypothetical protein